tara:strand:+ start:11523 stop:12788 length:1266 start_codon:yes stop_codon:yes gene_type:complete
MIDIFIINLLKLINKLIPTNFLSKKINNFNLHNAVRTIKMLNKAKKKNYSLNQKKIILFFSGIKLNIKNNDMYQNLLETISQDKNIGNHRNLLIEQLRNTNFSSVRFDTWLRLRNIFYLKLEIVLGGICREKALNYAEKCKPGVFLSKKNKARARLETTLNIKNFKNHLKQFPLEYDFNQEIFLKFLSAVHNIEYNISQFQKDFKDQKFFETLNGKTIAIVGPAETEHKDATEIDSFDYVVRFNYTHTGKNLDEFKKGLKTDISYFNGEQIDYLIKNNDSKLPNDLKIACIKDNHTEREKKLKKANPEKIIKKITNYNMLNFYSSFNLLPLVLLDLLETNSKKIKIFHSDLFLTSIRVAGYKKDLSNKEFIKTFLNHDPMTQHRFLKNLYKNDKIQGDDKFNEVMQLDTNDYLNKLERLYQ